MIVRKAFTVLLAAAAAAVFAGDAEVDLDDGRTAVLYEDSTWAFKSSSDDIEHDIVMTLGDGQTLALLKDGRWLMGRNLKVDQYKPLITLVDLTVTSTAKRRSVTQSRAAAKKKATSKLISRLRSHIKNSKVTSQHITQCVDGWMKDGELSTELGDENQIKLTIVLDRYDMEELERCLESRIEQPPEEQPAEDGNKEKAASQSQ